MRAATFLTLMTCCGTATGPSLAPEPVTDLPATTPPVSRPLPAPFRVVRTRRCASWDGTPLIATQREVFMCPGTVHDSHTGGLVALDPTYHHRLLIARDATRTLWILDDPDTRLDGPTTPWGQPLYDGPFTLELRGDTVRRFDLSSPPTAAAWKEATLVVATEAGLVEIDLRSGTQSTVEPTACAAALLLSIDADGGVRCLTQHEVDDARNFALTLVAPSGSRELPWIEHPRFDAAGRVLGSVEAGLVAFETDSTPSTIVEGRAHLLDIDADGSLLVSTDGATERIDPSGQREMVLAHASSNGWFVGETLIVESRDLVYWLERSATPPPAATFPAPSRTLPTWLVPAAADHDLEWTDYARRPDEVAAWVGTGVRRAFVTLAYLDSSEFVAFARDDAAWGRALLGRFVLRADQRRGRVYVEGGRRTFRGHAYIGGCERSHSDVLIVDMGDVLELWTATSPHGAGRLFGQVADDAMVADDIWGSRYVGDPSIGVVDR